MFLGCKNRRESKLEKRVVPNTVGFSRIPGKSSIVYSSTQSTQKRCVFASPKQCQKNTKQIPKETQLQKYPKKNMGEKKHRFAYPSPVDIGYRATPLAPMVLKVAVFNSCPGPPVPVPDLSPVHAERSTPLGSSWHVEDTYVYIILNASLSRYLYIYICRYSSMLFIYTH